MLHNSKGYTKLATLALWGGLVFTATGLLARLPEDGAHGAKTHESIPVPTVVNATSYDGSEDENGPDRASRERDIQDLQEKVRMLEAEVAALKRRNRIPER